MKVQITDKNITAYFSSVGDVENKAEYVGVNLNTNSHQTGVSYSAEEEEMNLPPCNVHRERWDIKAPAGKHQGIYLQTAAPPALVKTLKHFITPLCLAALLPPSSSSLRQTCIK